MPMLQSFSTGHKVALVANPSYQKGMFYRRFHGKVATIVGKKGKCYDVVLKDRGKSKSVTIHPVHMRKLH